MAAYILRRLLLIVPTLVGILLVNFILVQFMPGGPVEQVIARLESDTSATGRITGEAPRPAAARRATIAAPRACRPSSSPIWSGSSASTSRPPSGSC